MKLEPRPFSLLEQLIPGVEKGEVALPEFQRPFRWTQRDIEELLRTVARGWPAGTLLLLEGPGAFGYRPIAQAPPLHGQPKHLILDGQQRMTSLFHALRDRGKRTYFVRLGDVIQHGAFEDEDLRSETTPKFAKAYQSVVKAPDLSKRARWPLKDTMSATALPSAARDVRQPSRRAR